VIAFRVAQGENFATREFRQFLATLDELDIFHFFVSIVVQEYDDYQVTPQILLKHDVREDQKYIFNVELTNGYLQEQIQLAEQNHDYYQPRDDFSSPKKLKSKKTDA